MKSISHRRIAQKTASLWCSLNWFALITLVVACQKDDGMISDANNGKASSSGIIELSFEVETLTIPTLKNADNATSLEKIQAMPFSERNKIQVNAYEDGTTSWIMEKLRPKHDLSVQHETPPNDQPEVKVTRIDRTGMGSFYDSNDGLLFKHQVPVPSFKDVVANIKENPNAIFAAFGIKTVKQIELYIAQAKAKGHIIQDLGNGLISVRSGNNKNTTSNARSSSVSEEYTSVDIFNLKLGILMGSTLYDLQENILSQTFYRYKLIGIGV